MHYYNEFDQYAAAWLRDLMAEGAIPAGVVDERDIREVQPDELVQYVQCHFFAGIGGWPLALRLAGWPEDKPVWTASCPCPPFSSAGQKKSCPQCKGKDLVPHPYRTGFFVCCSCQHEWHADDRHLWPEVLRLVEKSRPPVLFGEQVASEDGRVWLAGVRATLEILGHGFGATDYCAAGVRAPQIRQRLYWVAESAGQLRDGIQQPRGRQPRSSDDGGTRRMASAEGTGSPAGEHAGKAGGETGPGPRMRRARGRRADGGMADTPSRGTGQRGDRPGIRSREAGQDRLDGGADGRLASADSEGRAPRDRRRSGEPEREPEHGRGASGLDDAGRERTEQRGTAEPSGDGPDDGISRATGAQGHGMGEPVVPRLEGHTGDGDDRDESRRVGAEAARPASETGDAGRLGNAESDDERRQPDGTHGPREQTGRSGDSSRLVDAESGRARAEEQQRREHGGERAGEAGFWDGWIWHPCTDGKVRRIPAEPAFFPRAPRLPGRVAMLKGFGNAIVPPQAAEFIIAYTETVKQRKL